jgi:hypothetical protein
MTLSESDEGKTVVDSSGQELGVVAEVREGAAFVSPMDDLASPTRGKLGWGGDDRDVYGLDQALVDAVTNSEVRLAEP